MPTFDDVRSIATSLPEVGEAAPKKLRGLVSE
jgi:hypothetical protein